MFDRIIPLIGVENLEKIAKKRILLVGVGGVGGFALETMIRSGFKNITIIDGDLIDETNLNRQIISTYNNIGSTKVLAAKARALAINPDATIKAQNVFLTKDNVARFLNNRYDYIIDACDDIAVKVEIIKFAKEKHIKMISCLGTGRKMNPTNLEITTLNKTYNDPLAKKLRHELKQENIDDIPVVFSHENAIKTEGDIVASLMFVPASAGILLAKYVFDDIINTKEEIKS